MRKQQSNRQRKNQAWRVAYWPDVQRIDSVPVLSSISHAWAQEYLDELSPPASKVLKYLAALNRTGKSGYCGVAVAYCLLAPQIEKATELKFSVRSMERGVAELKALGLIDVRPWVREAQTFRAGGKDVEMCGAGTIRLKDGRVVLRRLSIITLTDRALAFWEAPRCVTKTHTVGRKPSPAKLADSSPEPEKNLKKFIPTKSVLSDTVNVSCTEGRPTRPERPGRTDEPVRAVEHRALTPDQALSVPSTDTHKPPVLSSADTAEQQEALSNAPSPTATPPESDGKGCTKPKPVLGRGAHHRDSRSIARDCLLAGLHDLLSKHSPRQADTCYSRAKAEIDGMLPKGWPSVLDWDYWLGRWPKMSTTEREIKLLREILPVLKQWEPVTPNDQRAKFVDSLHGMPPQKEKTKIEDPFLAQLARRMGVADRFA